MRVHKLVTILLLIPNLIFYPIVAVSHFNTAASFRTYIPNNKVYLYKWERAYHQAEIEFSLSENRTWERLKLYVKNIEDVQRIVNRYPYREDFDQFSTEEYWQTPYEFLTNGGGDCEDYAITKYFLLRHLGYKDEDMQIVILKVETGEGHAVLIVKDGKKLLMLDNRYERILEVSEIPERYDPKFGMNATKYYQYF